MQPSEDDEIAVLRGQYVEKLDAIRAALQSARESLPARRAACDTERDKYERLSRRVMGPLLRGSTQGTGSMPEMPSATHAWLHGTAEGEAKANLARAQTALRALERQIESLEQDLSKWMGEIDFLDRVLAGERISSRLLAVPKPTPRLVEFDTIAPRERIA